MNRRKRLLIVGACLSVALLGMAIVAVGVAFHPLREGKGELKVDDCVTALAQTTVCRGEDTSFQECHYHFRAEGIPRADVCSAFIAPATPDASRFASIDGGAGACVETSPAEWTETSCAAFHIDETMRCFACDQPKIESSRHLVQAFDPACTRGVVLKSCNEGLE